MESAKTLNEWLAHCEALHPQGANGIVLGLERVRAVAAQLDDGLGLYFRCPVITVAGTNGKGSSCAMLESILSESGFKTGVYTSPHLQDFEERCRIAGEMVNATSLPAHFAAVETARLRAKAGGESLTYFEFTTLAILHLMSHAALDVAILEVGMGGRLDAVNSIDADCALITSIDIDHIAFLGDNRETIGFEKAGIMRAGKPVVVSDPAPPESLAKQAAAVGADLWQIGRDFHFEGDKQQWAWRASPERGSRTYAGMAYPALRGANQLLNASGVLAVLTALREVLPVTAQAVRTGLALVHLPGRFQIIPGQPAVVLDVAHNLHSVAALARNLDAMGYFPKTYAIFGAMADKDILSIFSYINAYIDVWYFCNLATPRAMPAKTLLSMWNSINKMNSSIASTYLTPLDAYRESIKNASSTDRIVVFGSFYTVGAVLPCAQSSTPSKH